MDKFAGHVGGRIKLRRLSIGMKRPDVARMIGISPQQIHKYETGRNSANVSRLIQLSMVLKTPVEFFFVGLPSYGKSPETEAETDDVLSIARCLVQLPTETREAVRSIIDAALEAKHGAQR